MNWLEGFDHILRVRTRPHTRLAYLRDVRRLIEALKTEPEHWTTQDIQHTLITLHAQGLSPRTLHRILSGWQHFFRYLAEQSPKFEHLLNLSLKLPKRAQTLPQTLSPDEVHHVLDSAASSEDTHSDLRTLALAELLYSSGLRISEVAQLLWKDLDFENGLVRVLGKGGKMREVPLGEKAKQMLLAWQKESQASNDAPLFANANGNPINVRTLQRWIHNLGLQTTLNRRLYPHLLRHSFASHMLQSSGDLRAVQEMLGHSSLQATQVYTHLDFQHLSQVYDQAHPRAKQKCSDNTPEFAPLDKEKK